MPFSAISSVPYDLEAVLRATAAGRLYFDLVHDAVIWDERSREIFGVAADFTGTYAAWRALVHEDDLSVVEREVERQFASSDEVSLRYRIRRPDGEVRHVWAVGPIRRGEDGRPLGVAGLHFDETEQRVGEARLRLQGEILGNIGEGVCVSSVETDRILYANHGLERLFGVECGGLMGAQVTELTGRSSSKLRRIAEVLAASGSWLGEVHNPRRDGSEFWTATTVTALRHVEHGEAWVWIICDLEKPRERDGLAPGGSVSVIYDAIADAVFSVYMADRSVEYVNRAVVEMFGWEAADVVGASTRRFYPDDASYAGFGGRLRQAFLSGDRQVRAEQDLVRRDGSRFRASILTTFVTADGELTRVISVIRDVSRERNLERQLVQAQKMEALGALAGGVAHDMNNVLAAVLTLTTVIHDELDAGSAHRDDLGKVIGAAERGKHLVENLLGLARKTAPSMEAIDLDREVDGVLSLLSHTLPKSVKLEVDLGAAGVFVRGDPTLLSQLLLNVCANARDAITESGTIRVTTRRTVLPVGHSVVGLEPGPHYELEVEDDGKGMSPEVLAHAFDPFFTTKDVGEGTGLGLSMAYSTVEGHGGAIQMQSEPGRGTRFSCWLPAAAPPDARRSTLTEAPKSTRRRVLFVDDEEILRQAAKRALEHLGYEVLVADGGVAAIDTVATATPPIDVVVLDLSMPQMDGAKCFAQLRALRPELRVLISTGHHDPGVTEALQRAGGVGLLKKPYRMTSLGQAIEALAGAGSAGS